MKRQSDVLKNFQKMNPRDQVETIDGALKVLETLHGWTFGVYNKLVELQKEVEEAKSDIDVQLKRRYDLIPNSVEAVKGYTEHEKKVLTEIAKLRSSEPGEINKFVVENYPKLEASHSFNKLLQELINTENLIANSREIYNEAVEKYNTYRQQFPGNLYGYTFGFPSQLNFFSITETERGVPKVAENQNVERNLEKLIGQAAKHNGIGPEAAEKIKGVLKKMVSNEEEPLKKLLNPENSESREQLKEFRNSLKGEPTETKTSSQLVYIAKSIIRNEFS